MKQKLCLLLLCAMLISAASGCASGGQSHDSAPSDTSDVSTGEKNNAVNDSAASAEPVPLSDDEIAFYQNFINRADVYGFLLSQYASPLDADYSQVFYSGAGVSQYPNGQMLQDYLEATGEEEIYTDIFYITASDVNSVIQNRTGYTLTAVLQSGNTIGLFYVDQYDAYFQMAGDTNRIFYRVTDGMHNGDGTVTVNSRTTDEWPDFDADGNPVWDTLDEPDDSDSVDTVADTDSVDTAAGTDTDISGDTDPDYYVEGFFEDPNEGFEDFGDDEWTSYFTTTFRETDGEPLIVSNEISGWLAEIGDWGYDTTEVTAEKPPFDAYTWHGYDENGNPSDVPPDDDTLPVTLELLSERDNNFSDADDWMADHWDEWMNDETFAAQQRYTVPGLIDIDHYYFYSIPDDRSLYVYDADDSTAYYYFDFASYLYPNGESAFSGDLYGIDAQNLRWALIIDGTLYVANSHRTYAESSGGQNAYLTAVNLWDGSVMWRSQPLVCNTMNFDVCGIRDGAWVDEGVLLCGYGFTGEDDYLYQISMKTGKVLDRTPLASAPDYVVYANGIVYVHCYNRDYEFEVSYG